MHTPHTPPSELYKTAGQRCALHDLGLITTEDLEKEAWVTAALTAVPMLWSGAKWLGKKMFGGGKATAGAAKGGVKQMGRQIPQAGNQVGQMTSPMMRPPTG